MSDPKSRWPTEIDFVRSKSHEYSLDLEGSPKRYQRLLIRHEDLLRRAGPAMSFVAFDFRVLLDTDPSGEQDPRLALAVGAPGEIAWHSDGLTDIGGATPVSQRPPLQQDLKDDYLRRVEAVGSDELVHIRFSSLQGRVAFHRPVGANAQQTILIVSSAAFGAGLSAVLEAFLALSLLRAQLGFGASESNENQGDPGEASGEGHAGN